MDQLVITSKRLQQMLNEAFKAGFECPSEFQDQEVERIYKKFIKSNKMLTADFEQEAVTDRPQGSYLFDEIDEYLTKHAIERFNHYLDKIDSSRKPLPYLSDEAIEQLRGASLSAVIDPVTKFRT